jgi:hypothetical protein
MFENFLLYNFLYFKKKRKYDDSLSWFYACGAMSLGTGFNIATVLFFILEKYYPGLRVENPGYVIIGIPMLLSMLILYFNNGFYKRTMAKKTTQIDNKVRITYWVYYAVTLLIYAVAMSSYSQGVS